MLPSVRAWLARFCCDHGCPAPPPPDSLPPSSADTALPSFALAAHAFARACCTAALFSAEGSALKATSAAASFLSAAAAARAYALLVAGFTYFFLAARGSR